MYRNSEALYQLSYGGLFSGNRIRLIAFSLFNTDRYAFATAACSVER